MTACLLIEESVLNSFEEYPERDERGRTVFENSFASRSLSESINAKLSPPVPCSAGRLSLGGMLYAFYTSLSSAYMEDLRSLSEELTLGELAGSTNGDLWDSLFESADRDFPAALAVRRGDSPADLEERIIDLLSLQLLWSNPAASSFTILYPSLEEASSFFKELPENVAAYLRSLPLPPGWDESLLHLLLKPQELFADSLEEQIRFITGSPFYSRLGNKTPYLKALDLANEENKFGGPGPGPVEGIDFSFIEDDTPRFSDDSDWMPKLILIAKNCYVWLFQLFREVRERDKNPQRHPRGRAGRAAPQGDRRAVADRALGAESGIPQHQKGLRQSRGRGLCLLPEKTTPYPRTWGGGTPWSI